MLPSDMMQNLRNNGTYLSITINIGKILLETYPVVHSQVDYVVLEDEVMVNNGEIEGETTKFEKLEKFGENKSIVEQLFILKDDN